MRIRKLVINHIDHYSTKSIFQSLKKRGLFYCWSSWIWWQPSAILVPPWKLSDKSKAPTNMVPSFQGIVMITWWWWQRRWYLLMAKFITHTKQETLCLNTGRLVHMDAEHGRSVNISLEKISSFQSETSHVTYFHRIFHSTKVQLWRS